MTTTRLLSSALKLNGITAAGLGQSVSPPVSDRMVWHVAAGSKKSSDGRVESAIAETIRAAGLTPAPDRAPVRGRSASA